MFVRDCWYVIAWEHEIPADGLFARRVLGEPIVVFRTENGIAALEDRCCHRAAPLSRGRKEGNSVRCGYHGLKFDADGRCVEIPGQTAPPPPQARVRSYPVALHRKWVFVWMGEPARADRAMLPDNYSNEHSDWRYLPGYMHYDSDYLLICDNLLDFSHLSYVHEKTLGGSLAIARSQADIEPVMEAGQRGLRVTRRVADVPPPPYYRKLRQFVGNVDRWFIYDFLLPGTLLMRSGGRPVGAAEDDMRGAVQLHSCQTLTPETETSTHYFFQQSHSAELEDAVFTQDIYDNLILAFNEDRDMITAQKHNIALRPDGPMLAIVADAALIQFRRLLQRAVEAERALAAV